jgi:MerR family mercuric resistance operon transcriptional regulator
MPELARTAGGHRVYEDRDMSRLSFILRAREMGFPLASVQELLTLVDRGDYSCGEAQGIAAVHLENLRKKLADLQRLEETLVGLVNICRNGTKPDCAFIQELFRPRTP